MAAPRQLVALTRVTFPRLRLIACYTRPAVPRVEAERAARADRRFQCRESLWRQPDRPAASTARVATPQRRGAGRRGSQLRGGTAGA
jgi:hypothetical protein